MNISEKMVGKKAIVRGNVAGVHAGIIEAYEPGKATILLKEAYRLWRVHTRDKSGSISDVAANGLKPKGDHQIGAKLKSTLIENPNGLEVSEMTDEAYATLADFAPKEK